MRKKNSVGIAWCNLFICASAIAMRYSIPVDNRNIVFNVAYLVLLIALITSGYFLNGK